MHITAVYIHVRVYYHAAMYNVHDRGAEGFTRESCMDLKDIPESGKISRVDLFAQYSFEVVMKIGSATIA